LASNADDTDRSMGRAMQRILVFILCLVALAAFILWRLDNPRVERIRMAVVDTLAPSMEWTGEPLRFFAEMTTDFENFTRVYEQNQELRQEIQRLRAWREVAQQREEENAQLRALNKVRLSPRIAYVTGEVIADSGGPFLAAGLVNVGYRDGVADGAAAMDGAGLVGRVVGVGRRTARVLFVTDYSSRIPVKVLPSGKRAILSGDNTPAPRINFLEDPALDVRPGDPIVTSGDGGVFPPELPVGVALADPEGRPRARLSADFARLHFVRLLRYDPETVVENPGGLITRPHGPSPDLEAKPMIGATE
jgi:rod shape-determining protein MreC